MGGVGGAGGVVGLLGGAVGLLQVAGIAVVRVDAQRAPPMATAMAITTSARAAGATQPGCAGGFGWEVVGSLTHLHIWLFNGHGAMVAARSGC